MMEETNTVDLVVYIEDNPDAQFLVQWMLEATKRYTVLTAKDGLSGLALVQQHHPALVLIDLDVPLLHGLDIARRIRTDPALKDIPLIAVSASVMQREQQRCLDEGCVAFIEKPFDIHHFRELVAKHIRIRRQTRADPPHEG